MLPFSYSLSMWSNIAFEQTSLYYLTYICVALTHMYAICRLKLAPITITLGQCISSKTSLKCSFIICISSVIHSIVRWIVRSAGHPFDSNCCFYRCFAFGAAFINCCARFNYIITRSTHTTAHSLHVHRIFALEKLEQRPYKTAA